MMTTTMTPAPITASLRALTQRIREEIAIQEFDEANDKDVLSGLMQVIDRADVPLAELDAAEQAIQTNANLSEAGKTKAMIEAVATCHSGEKFVTTAAKDRQAAAAELRRALDAVPKGSGEPVLDYLQSAEIRTELKKLAQHDRMRLFLEAVQQGNTTVLRAIQTDPLGGTPLIPADFLKRVLEENIQQNKPTEWRRWQTLVFAAERLQILSASIEFQMAGYGKLPAFPTPPTRKTDLHMQNTQQDPKKSRADQPPVGAGKFQ